MSVSDILELMRAVRDGAATPEQAAQQLQSFEELGFAKVDHGRKKRQGFAEVIFGAGKTTEQILKIAGALHAQGEENILCTRLSGTSLSDLMALQKPYIEIKEIARAAVFWPRRQTLAGLVAVVCAGTSDLPVAEEAAVTAEVMGAAVTRITDAGVAGLNRILAHTQVLRSANAIVCAAGMEGALPSVVAGLTDRPIIAVPTSVGYGAAFGGLAALLGMLNSCGSGVSVVNIDNGFGAGYSAALINRLACRADCGMSPDSAGE